MNVVVATGFDGLLGLCDTWRRLFDESGSDNPFLTWEWTVGWARAYASTRQVIVLVVEQNGQPVAISPLMLSGRKLSFLSDSHFADYSDILLHPDALGAVGEIIDHIQDLQGWGCAVFEHIPEISPSVTLLNEALGRSEMNWRRDIVCGNPRIKTDGDFEAFYAERGQKLRQEIRTTVNHLSRAGRWRYVEAVGGSRAQEIYSALVWFHAARQKGKQRSSIFRNGKNRAFFRELIDKDNGPMTVHLSAIELDGRLISAAYALRCGKVFYYWIPSFDPEMRGVSLGKLHIKCLLEKCFVEDTEWFDFMGGDERYKFQWTEDGYEVYRYVLHRSVLRHGLADLRYGVRQNFKAVKDCSPILQRLWRVASKIGR